MLFAFRICVYCDDLISVKLDYLNRIVVRVMNARYIMTAPFVTISDGQLKGKLTHDYLGGDFYSFLGIPYGKPPIGELRFKAPQPAEPWIGVRNATKEGKECPSRHPFFRTFIGSEKDCLNLNVYTKELPTEKSNKLKPVMFWIHGGAFLYGCNRTEFFGPKFLMIEDIVLVSINYRLGVFGFLSLEDSSLGIPGNAGLKDMVLALKWVQRNIEHFMGDPNNVTIFGESAGAAAVHYLILSPMAKGLFHKAIAQSGCALNCWAQGKSNGQTIARHLGCKETDEKKVLEHLKQMSAQKIVNLQMKPIDPFLACVIRPFGPVVEKPSNEPAFLDEEPMNILKKATFNKVPVIMGYNSKEGIFFEVVRKIIPNVTVTKDFETEIHHDMCLSKDCDNSREVALKIKKYYFGDEEPSLENIDKLFLLKSDNQFIHGIHRCIQYQKEHSPIYFYRMSLESSFNYYKTICTSKCLFLLFFLYFLSNKSAGRTKNLFLKIANGLPKSNFSGVCHADDLGYIFHTFLHPPVTPNSEEDVYIKRFVKLWTNFARTGNPTCNTSSLLNNVEWKPVTLEENHFLDIGRELKIGVAPDVERMKFWDSLYDQHCI